MPELPDIVVYISSLERLLGGKRLTGVSIKSPFLLRSFEHDVHDCIGKQVTGFRRIGKRVVWELEGDWFLVFHLMIAGRFHWKSKLTMPKGKNDLAAFQFEHGTMMLTEASTKKRASLHVVVGETGLSEHDPAGLEVLDCSLNDFRDALTAKNHTVKRALTSPRIFSGIGNAYSDEILFHAKLSPVKWTSRLSDEEIARLFESVQSTLKIWTQRLAKESENSFPEKVTAFRDEMAAHGKFKQPCIECETKIQRIVFADRETNYCPRCQTGGKMLADRSLSRLLKDDWPKTIEEWES